VAELEKPAHLQPVDDASAGAWLAKRKAAAAAAALGLLSFIVVAIGSGELAAVSDLRLALPGFVLALAASVYSLVRREPQGYWLWPLGLALAGCAIFLGWFLMIMVIVAAAALLIFLLHAIL
jgi:hypothetical protein